VVMGLRCHSDNEEHNQSLMGLRWRGENEDHNQSLMGLPCHRTKSITSH
jgi:hypothetical protein